MHDGTLDLLDIARMNEILDIEAENAWRVAKAQEANRPK